VRVPVCEPPPVITLVSACRVPEGSVDKRPVKAIEGKTELPLERLYPTAISPTLSIAMLPIQR
jgi:hypothetical protein